MSIIFMGEIMYKQTKALKLKFSYKVFINLGPISQKTQSASIIKISWLMLFSEIITVYSENILNECSDMSVG
jgi:hypothetical protein